MGGRLWTPVNPICRAAVAISRDFPCATFWRANHSGSKWLKSAQKKSLQFFSADFTNFSMKTSSISVSDKSMSFRFKKFQTVEGLNIISQFHNSNCWRVYAIWPNCVKARACAYSAIGMIIQLLSDDRHSKWAVKRTQIGFTINLASARAQILKLLLLGQQTTQSL